MKLEYRVSRINPLSLVDSILKFSQIQGRKFPFFFLFLPHQVSNDQGFLFSHTLLYYIFTLLPQPELQEYILAIFHVGVAT